VQIAASDQELAWAYELLLKLPTAWVHYWALQHMPHGTAVAPKVNEDYCRLDKDADIDNYREETAETVLVMFEEFLD